MNRFAFRLTLLYSVLAFVMLLSIVAAGTAVVLGVVDRGFARDVHTVALRVPALAKNAPGSTFALRATYLISQLRGNGVGIAAIETASGERIDQLDPGNPQAGGGQSGPGGPAGPGGPGPGNQDDQIDGGPGGPGGYEGPGGPPPLPVTHTRSSEAPLTGILADAFYAEERVPVEGGTILLFPSNRRVDATALAFTSALVGALLLAGALAFAIGRFVTINALQPVREVIAELQRFGTGDFEVRDVTANEREGFAELAGAYNAAAAQVKRALAERTKAEGDMRQFVADAAHELRTPLTVVMGYVDLLRSGVDAEMSPRIFSTISLETRRMRDLIAKLIALARLEAPMPPRTANVDLAGVVEGALDTLPALEATLSLRLDLRRGIVVSCDATEIEDALVNVFTNAMKYAPGSDLEVSLRAQGNRAVLDIGDTGPGMSAIERGNAFRRFYRGDARGDIEGSGLGLSIVERVIARAGGVVDLASAPGKGTRLTIELPLAIPGPGPAH